MRRKTLLTTIVLAAAFPAGFLLLAQDEGSGLSRVFVTNFPEVQEVQGKVQIDGTISHARLASIQDVTVTPVQREQTTRLVDAGVIDTAGFTDMVLGVAGEVKAEHFAPGRIGAVLLPDDERVQKAFVEKQVFFFPIDVASHAEPGNAGLFSSASVRVPIAFPRYRVLLYNTTDRATSVNVFAYMTN